MLRAVSDCAVAPLLLIGCRVMAQHHRAMQVSQEAMEATDGCAGKYTVGLGQLNMSFCDDREDVVSLALTAVWRLLESHGIDPTLIGRWPPMCFVWHLN